jgi:hypothetical protein
VNGSRRLIDIRQADNAEVEREISIGLLFIHGLLERAPFMPVTHLAPRPDGDVGILRLLRGGAEVYMGPEMSFNVAVRPPVGGRAGRQEQMPEDR